MKRALFVCLLFVAWTGSAYAQWDTSPGAQTGIKSTGSYFSGDIDTIGLYNGNLVLNIPLLSLPGRELSRELRATYNSQKWEVNPANTNIGMYSGGWQTVANVAGWFYTDDQLSYCEEDIGYWVVTGIWFDPLGARRSYVKDVENVDIFFEGSCNSEEPPLDITLHAADRDGSVMSLTGSGTSVTLRDGTRIEPGVRISPNGNTLSDMPYMSYSGFGDTVGRAMTVSLTTTSGTTHSDSYTITDINGDPKIYVFNYDTHHEAYDPLTIYSNHTRYLTVLTSIDLPNGKSYEFEYAHDQGFLTKVTLPSGAYIRYVHAGCSGSGQCTNHTAADDYIIKRIVSADGTSGAEKTWEYNRSVATYLTVSVKSPDDSVVEHVLESRGFEIETRWKESDTTLVQTVQTTWDSYLPLPTETTTIVGSLKRTTTLTYDGEYRVTQKDDSDWYTGGTATPLARTSTAYTTLGGGLGVVDSVTASVWDGSDYVVQGKTEYDHDESGYSNASVSGTVPNHVTPYGDRGNVTTIRRFTDASNYVTEHFHYDVLGNMVEHVDPLSNSTYTSYADNYSDSTNRYSYAFPTLITNALSQTSAIEYDFNTGLVTETTDARGQTASTTYDFMSRPLTVSTPGGGQTEYDYDDDALTVEEKALVATGKYRTTTTTMDGLYRPIETVLTDPDGDVHVLTEYDDNGRAYRVSQPYRSGTPVWSQTAFDALSRPITITNPDSTTVQFAYSGNTVTQTDEDGVQRRQTFDGLGQLTKVALPDPSESSPSLSSPLTTVYTYRPVPSGTYAGLVEFGVKQYDEGSPNQTRTFIRDWLGRLKTETHPETGTNTYTYDAAGQVASRTDARGSGYEATYTYDDIGRPLTITYADSTPDIAYTYDQTFSSVQYKGLLTTVTVGASNSDATTYTYTAAGQVASENRTFYGVTGTFSSSYTYDLGGRMLSATYPSGRVVTYSYQASGSDAADRIYAITDSPTSKTLVSSVTDNAAGLVTSLILGTTTNTKIEHAFNTRNQLTGITAKQDSWTTTLLNLAYDYGSTTNVGRIRARTDAVEPQQSVSYTYDAMYRLKQVSRTATDTPAWSIAWTFDKWGNRTVQTASGLSEVASQSIGYNGSNQNNAFTYDDAGNVTSEGSGNFSYSWDAEGRMKQSSQFGGGSSLTVSYAYDAEGRRVKKTTSAGTTYYMYGITGLQSEFSTVNSGATSASTLTNRLTFRVPEQTGTGVLLLDEAGAVVENNRVLPYGDLFKAISGSTNDDKFTTYNRDAETGNDYAMARYYAKQYGAFLSPDPGHVGADPNDPRSWNAYVYVADDPINGTDPTGMLPSWLRWLGSRNGGGGGGESEAETSEQDVCMDLSSFACPNTGSLSGEFLARHNERLADAEFRPGGGVAQNQNQIGTFSEGFDRAIDRLTSRRKCRDMFLGGVDPRSVLWGMQAAGGIAGFKFADLRGDYVDANATTELVPLYPFGRLVVGTITTINTGPLGFFSAGRGRNQMAATIIHELGHVYHHIYGAGSTTLRTPDTGPDIAKNRLNTDDVVGNCGL